MDATGYVVVLINEPDGSLLGDVLEAANLCPTGAIQISS
jgi:ferredoxin